MVRDDEAVTHRAKEDDPSHERAAAIDLDHLARYTLGNRSLQAEVLGLFRGQSETYLQNMKDARNAKAWADAAHTLKGSARSVGAMAVARRAELSEALAGDPGGADHESAVQELSMLIGEANRFIEKELGSALQDA